MRRMVYLLMIALHGPDKANIGAFYFQLTQLKRKQILTEIIDNIFPLLKEIIMTYGLYETAACVALVVLLWQLPSLLNATLLKSEQIE